MDDNTPVVVFICRHVRVIPEEMIPTVICGRHLNCFVCEADRLVIIKTRKGHLTEVGLSYLI